MSALAFRAKQSWGYSEQFMEQCRAELTVSEDDIVAGDYFVLESEGAIVGFCALLARGEDEGELADVFIDPRHHGAGLGRRLVAHAKQGARARGWRSLRVEADPNACAFYRSCGGEQVGTVASGSIPGRSLPLMKISL
ncbi:MAG: GNAT family N-acetyltransferase [Gammaproteobacteria bacterium]|nr:GNAT family N-acetyltransferase [Gammaproteobacteria bacterium]